MVAIPVALLVKIPGRIVKVPSTCSLTMWKPNQESATPIEWENQEKYRGGWELKNGKLELKNRFQRQVACSIYFTILTCLTIDDYYEPWTYNYETLPNSPAEKHQPVARPKSAITGEIMEIQWGPNWEDDLAGGHITGCRIPM